MSLYSEIDLPHEPTDHPDWQESWVLLFRDYKTDMVGFLRVGSYVNQGTTQAHWGMALPDGRRFRRHLMDRKLEPGDRTETSANAGLTKFSLPNMEYCHWQASDPDAELDLRMYDFFPSQEWAVIGGEHHGMQTSHDYQHGHPESAGRIEGRVRLGDQVVEIKDGIAYRDHGYGPRPLPMFRSARWHAGTVGPALSYSLVTFHEKDGSFKKFGWLMKDGKREAIRDMHTVNCSLCDGFSSIGGWTVVILESGEELRIEAEAIDGCTTSTILPNGGPGSSPAGVEVLSKSRWNGHEGMCDFNMIDNAHMGMEPVANLFLANTTEGLSQREFDPNWVRHPKLKFGPLG